MRSTQGSPRFHQRRFHRFPGRVFRLVQFIAARGGRIILITDAEGADHAASKTLSTLELPEMDFDRCAVRFRHSSPAHRPPYDGDDRDRH